MESLKKMVELEASKLSKKEKKRRSDLGWVGKGTTKAPVIFDSKKHKEARRLRKQNLAAEIRKVDFWP